MVAFSGYLLLLLILQGVSIAFLTLPNVGNVLLRKSIVNWAVKLDFNEDFYSILEVSPAVSALELKKAYYKIVFKYHPDNKPGAEQKELCNRQMMVINAAYKVLRDPTSRKKYDRQRGMKSTAASAAEKQTRLSARPEPDTGPVDSLASILSDLMKDIMENDGKNAVGDLLSSLDKWLESAMSGADEAPRDDSGLRLDQQGVQRAGPDGALGEGGAPVRVAIVPSSELGAVQNPYYHTSVNSEERARTVEEELQRLKRQRDAQSGG